MMMLVALAALSLVKRRPVEWGAGWMWPVPDAIIGGNLYRPVITDGFGSPRPGGRLHTGVDVMYRRRTALDQSLRYPPRTPSGSAGAFAPEGTPIVAARAGRVWSAKRTPRGFAVVLDHGTPFETFYQHLDVLVFPEHRHGVNVATGKPTPIKAGDLLGTMGFDPLDPQRLRHLHFAVWLNGNDDAAIDPKQAMESWTRVPWQYDPQRKA